ncbi:UDP-N-acetylglucosamine diphosphorylase/glucosamine-1-phosphate N-acetyltransferase [Lishizhenia tianjinensis]|uniref:UDP-N-acetylglucosamine diphosphorylase/glucosamine-1-phosphate N-acetyltransferase n=1 Tax=Lishizhenia tianjinensis TaxID=477690 RepID=A0A1I6YMK7_9FLAO|nr:putative sugar nucleotidyl transferase [Lishizhenia tianjinensis]SFT51675.1 UDP-N-acetylglucosamine diphosphorylase/glucosamine-1-phosphate N-acetyltransferase [Lishizhenia tianjinensis]
MNIILHDNGKHLKFAPLTLTRPVGNLRMGMFTNNQRWEMYLPDAQVSYVTEEYLSKKYPAVLTEDNFFVNAAVIPSSDLIAKMQNLATGEAIFQGEEWIAFRGESLSLDTANHVQIEDLVILEERWDIYQKNAEVLAADFAAYTQGKTSQPLSESNTVIGDASQIFLEEGAVVEACILNTKSGPIYVGKDAEIMEGSVVRGALAMAEHSALKLATKVYGATSLGEHCKVGGEVNNVVFQAYSNKGHDGFLGNSLVGEWCNLGADTNSSNLKNNYGLVKAYSYESESIDATNVQFMGVCMGDHSKCGINTMFNTATVVGVSANVYGGDFPPKYIPSFAWGGSDGFVNFKIDKAFEVAENMMGRRGISLTQEDKDILKYVADNFSH